MTGMGLTPEELDDLAWALLEAFPEVNVNPVHSPDFWPGKATALLPVINKIRDRARDEGERAGAGQHHEEHCAGREITLDEALEKKPVDEAYGLGGSGE